MFRQESQLPSLADLESPTNRRLILITGTPGSGKRSVGHLLVDEWSFVHLDLENRHANTRFLGEGVDGLRAEVEANLEPGQDMVVTWNPVSKDALPMVRVMQSLGFEWIWFDSDRGAAFGAFRAFGASIRYPRRFPRPRFVDPFASDGSFRPLAGVISDVLDPSPRVEPRLAPVRSIRDSLATSLRSLLAWRPAFAGTRSGGARVRWGFSGGLAVVAAAAVAVAAYVAGGLGGAQQPARVALNGGVAQAKPAALPRRGLLVSGRSLSGVKPATPSLAGVRLGDSRATVLAQWGHNFTVCASCKPTTWFYFYPSGDPVGAGVKFRNGRVTAVFTLGMTMGWRAENGVQVGQMLDADIVHDNGRWVSCDGFSAKTHPASGNAVTSILTTGPTVYGFSLTRPHESVCH